MSLTLASAVAAFGSSAKEKLANPAATGQPEDQLRAPFETLLEGMAILSRLPPGSVRAVGESSIGHLRTRPDYAITVSNALVGFVEIKAPGKGADPRRFKEPHDKEQWEHLRSLPNLLYTDGNTFSLWQDGELVGSILALEGDIRTSGKKLTAPAELAPLFETFMRWRPIPPRSVQDLAHTTARLCRLLRNEVTEQLALKSEALTSLAEDWRVLLFPDATDERFADGYAQAVTFGLLMARAKNISLATDLQQVAIELGHTSSLIGAALRLLTDNAENQRTLKTALGTLTRVLEVVDWEKISRGNPDSWLYFYEDFLEVYDNELRKQTGSYYTPPEVVGAMVALVDEALRSPRYGLHSGLASPTVTLVDPAAGTGTFILGVLRRIADTVRSDEGDGAVKNVVQAALKRLIAFEIQLGPFAVAQLRILAEVVDLTESSPKTPPRLFVTNTLGNPDDDEGWIPGILAPIAKSRKDANKIKRDEPITVVVGNPPYKEKAKGKGGWVEGASDGAQGLAPLERWMPPPEWGAGAHSKHLRNLYIYFWRWATWKVYDHGPGNRSGIVCFITVAGFLNGPGFQQMRAYLRETCDDIWVIDCSPEGHQPEVNTRIFQGVQQPVCIVITSRSKANQAKMPATVRFRALPKGHRSAKCTALSALRLADPDWITCPADDRAPFLPASTGAWAGFPKLESFFLYNGSGVQSKRTWVVAPDQESLRRRWLRLIAAPEAEKESLFHATLRDGVPADRHIHSVVKEGLPGFPVRLTQIADEREACAEPVSYGFRSFNRQWIIPDARVITQPNAELWKSRSSNQVYMTAPSDRSPTAGPALTFSALVPDLHHYNGRGGRVFPLWRDEGATGSNFKPDLLNFLAGHFKMAIPAPDLMAYIAAIAAHSAFTVRFHDDLSTPGLRIPITSSPAIFGRAVDIGRNVIWLHTFGERMASAREGRPAGPPRLPAASKPFIPKGGSIPEDPATMPDLLAYEPDSQRLLVGQGYVERVTPAMWQYEVSGKQVLTNWFSYRKRHRDRPIIGDRRQPSVLGEIQPDYWLPEYTSELLNVLNVLGRLVDLEPRQATLLEEVCNADCISSNLLDAAGAFDAAPTTKRKLRIPAPPSLF